MNVICDVAAGFSPPFAEAPHATKRVRWKAKAFPYIDCTNCAKQLSALMNPKFLGSVPLPAFSREIERVNNFFCVFKGINIITV